MLAAADVGRDINNVLCKAAAGNAASFHLNNPKPRAIDSAV